MNFRRLCTPILWMLDLQLARPTTRGNAVLMRPPRLSLRGGGPLRTIGLVGVTAPNAVSVEEGSLGSTAIVASPT